MKLKNQKNIIGIVIPYYLKGKITITSNCELHEEEIMLFNLALKLINERVAMSPEIEPCDFSAVNVIFTENGELTLLKDDDKVYIGLQFYSIVYVLRYLRETENQRFILFAFLEELVHHYWRVTDEIEVKYIVLEIMQQYDKNVTLEMIKGWKLIE